MGQSPTCSTTRAVPGLSPQTRHLRCRLGDVVFTNLTSPCTFQSGTGVHSINHSNNPHLQPAYMNMNLQPWNLSLGACNHALESPSSDEIIRQSCFCQLFGCHFSAILAFEMHQNVGAFLGRGTPYPVRTEHISLRKADGLLCRANEKHTLIGSGGCGILCRGHISGNIG